MNSEQNPGDFLSADKAAEEIQKVCAALSAVCWREEQAQIITFTLTVVGYRPQLARSGSGFVTAVLPGGNAADSPHLVPMVRCVVEAQLADFHASRES